MYIIKKVLKEIGTNDLKILNWLSNASPKDLAKLANILFAAKKKSKIANKILNEGITERDIFQSIFYQKKE